MVTDIDRAMQNEISENLASTSDSVAIVNDSYSTTEVCTNV